MSHTSVITCIAAALLAGALVGGDVRAAGNALEAAREELRLRIETERRMRRDFETLLASGRMSASEVSDFEGYLVDLSVMVDRQRQVVAELQGSASPGAGAAGTLPADYNRGQTDAEKIALLDAELGSSLSEFDDTLLREQKELAEKSRSASTGEPGAEPRSGGDAAESGEGQGEQQQGKAGGEAPQDSSGSTGRSGQSGQTGEQPEAGGGAEGNDRVASAGGPGEAGRAPGNANVPPDIPDGKDDDIVARQLREAAESEQDPELREKLWDEYRKYKNRTR